MAADWICTRKQVNDRALEGKSHERKILEAVLPLNSKNLSRLVPDDMDLGTSSGNTLTNKCFGSPKWESEETELPDGSESSSTLGLTSWTTASFHIGEELGVRRQTRSGKGDLTAVRSMGPLAEQDDASPASNRGSTAGSFKETVAARRRAARRRLLGADGAFVGEHAAGFCGSDCLRCNPRRPAERPSE